MSRIFQVTKLFLGDFRIFSSLVIGLPLHDYQLASIGAVLDSVKNGYGREFLLVFPRQSGKNEAVAQLLVYLLNIFQRVGGQMVFGATGDALGRGINRLEERLGNQWTAGHWKKATKPERRILGNAAVVFLSTHPSASSRGETAHWILIIDELQDQDPSHIEAVFEPMRAAENATALYIGTVKTTTDALWLKKQLLEQEQEKDGLQRVFIVSPETVTAANPTYGRFLENKIASLGRRHPIVLSEYFNQPVNGQGGLFTERRLALMRGKHGRDTQHGRRSTGPSSSPGHSILATLDVAGQDEAATDPVQRLANPGRDYTVAHVFEAEMIRPDDPGPTYQAVDIFVDHGSRHFQDAAGRPNLALRLLAWLQAWNIVHLVADASGVGAGLVDWLSARVGPGRVTGYQFSPSHKAALGSTFISVVETGRFNYWAGEDEPLADGWWFFTQAAACQYSLPAEGRFERDLRWGVPASARVSTAQGSLPVHDDRLISAALVAVYDALYRDGKLQLGHAHSAIIPPVDPLDDLDF